MYRFGTQDLRNNGSWTLQEAFTKTALAHERLMWGSCSLFERGLSLRLLKWDQDLLFDSSVMKGRRAQKGHQLADAFLHVFYGQQREFVPRGQGCDYRSLQRPSPRHISILR
ncbi:uncharacterized protein LOC144605267 [Rhinoraja longicauda]